MQRRDPTGGKAGSAACRHADLFGVSAAVHVGRSVCIRLLEEPQHLPATLHANLDHRRHPRRPRDCPWQILLLLGRTLRLQPVRPAHPSFLSFPAQLERASISTTSILVATFPAVITHVARVVGGEDRRERRLQSTVGVLLCCLGCALVIATPQRAQTPSSLAGILFSLLSVICSTTALFAQRRMSLDVDMSLVSAFTSLIAGLIVLGASLSLAPSPAIFHQRTLHIFTNSQSLVALLFYIFFTATTMPLKAWSVTLLGPSTFGGKRHTKVLFL